MAGAYFLELVTKMTLAKKDQDHFDVIMVSSPNTPDRTGFILGKTSESPLPSLVSAGNTLKNAGATLIALPCFTAHYFREELEKNIGIPVINAIRDTADYLKLRGITRVGIMATEGTIGSLLYQNALEDVGISSVIPEALGQMAVNSIIYDNIKAMAPVDMDSFNRVSEDLFDKGAEVVLLGCTELSLIKRDYGIPGGFLDVMEVLSQRAVRLCGELREEYEELITK